MLNVVRLTAAMAAIPALSAATVNGLPVQLSAGVHGKSAVHERMIRPDGSDNCPPGNQQYVTCVAPTLSNPATFFAECDGATQLSGNAFASRVKNGKLVGLVKNLPVQLVDGSYYGAAIFSVVKKNPKTKHGIVKFAYLLTKTCASGTIHQLIGID